MSNIAPRCPEMGLACSTAYVREGCRCSDCQGWQSERLARSRHPQASLRALPRGHSEPVRTPAPVSAPIGGALVRVRMPSEVAPVRAPKVAPVLPGVRPGCSPTSTAAVSLSCGDQRVVPWWVAYPGAEAQCSRCGPVRVERLLLGATALEAPAPWPTTATVARRPPPSRTGVKRRGTGGR
jgi:hypothetical protein